MITDESKWDKARIKKPLDASQHQVLLDIYVGAIAGEEPASFRHLRWVSEDRRYWIVVSMNAPFWKSLISSNGGVVA